jgi:hypothetical protein
MDNKKKLDINYRYLRFIAMCEKPEVDYPYQLLDHLKAFSNYLFKLHFDIYPEEDHGIVGDDTIFEILEEFQIEVEQFIERKRKQYGMGKV